MVTVELCKDLRFFTRTVVFKIFLWLFGSSCSEFGAVSVTSVKLYLCVQLCVAGVELKRSLSDARLL